MKKALITLVILTVVAGATGAWLTLRDTPEELAYAELENLVGEIEQLHPECANFDALMTSRVRGTNGWEALLRAGTAADVLLEKETPLANQLNNLDDAEWCAFAATGDDARQVLADTEDLHVDVLHALRADCIVETGPAMDFRNTLAMFDLAAIQKARVGALATLGRTAEARVELLQLVQLAGRVEQGSNIAIWVGNLALRKSTLQWTASHLPRVDPDAAFKKQIEAALESPRPEFREALQGELATLLWQARTWVLDGGLDEIRRVVGAANSSTFNDVTEYLNVYPAPLRAASAALDVLKRGQDLEDEVTARAMIDAARPWAGDQILMSLTESRVRGWLATGLRVDAAELALRLRCFEPVASSDRAAATRVAERYPVLRLDWLDDGIEVHARPEAPIVALAGTELSGALATFKWVPDPLPKQEPARNPRRFR